MLTLTNFLSLLIKSIDIVYKNVEIYKIVFTGGINGQELDDYSE